MTEPAAPHATTNTPTPPSASSSAPSPAGPQAPGPGRLHEVYVPGCRSPNWSR